MLQEPAVSYSVGCQEKPPFLREAAKYCCITPSVTACGGDSSLKEGA